MALCVYFPRPQLVVYIIIKRKDGEGEEGDGGMEGVEWGVGREMW